MKTVGLIKNKGFIKLYRSVLSKPEVADLVAEQGAAGFGTYMIILLYLAQCDDFEGAFTNSQLSALAARARKSRDYVRKIICDFGLFVVEGKRFHDSFRNEYSPARTNRYAGEEIDIDKEKENKEKAARGCVSADTPTADEKATPDAPSAKAAATADGATEATADATIGPSAYEHVDRKGLRHGSQGEKVPWWAPPQVNVRYRWSTVSNCWMPPGEIDLQAERRRRARMPPEDFMMKTAYEKLNENEHHRIQDHASRE